MAYQTIIGFMICKAYIACIAARDPSTGGAFHIGGIPPFVLKEDNLFITGNCIIYFLD